MHPFFADVSTWLATVGRTNPAVLMALTVTLPAAVTFAAVVTFRKMTRAVWRGYWDVV